MFDPKAFYDIASEFCTPRSTEAHLRTSISRSYYASFLLARETLSRNGIYTPTRTGADHAGGSRVLEGLKLYKLRDDLAQLRRLRTMADYDLGATVGLRSAERAKSIAKELLKGISGRG